MLFRSLVLQLRRGANSKSKMTAFSKIVEQEEKVGVTLAKKKKRASSPFYFCVSGLISAYVYRRERTALCGQKVSKQTNKKESTGALVQ